MYTNTYVYGLFWFAISGAGSEDPEQLEPRFELALACTLSHSLEPLTFDSLKLWARTSDDRLADYYMHHYIR